MPKLHVISGTAGKLMRVFIRDTSQSTLIGLPGVTAASTGIKWYLSKVGDTGSTPVTPVTTGVAVGTWTSGGIIAVDATNMPGMYELGVPNSGLNGADVHMMIYGVTNMEVVPIEVQTTNVPIPAASLVNGAIDFAQYAGDLLAVLARVYLVTTAVTTPLSADVWYVAGLYNGLSFWKSLTTNLTLWNNGTSWIISPTVGTAGNTYWTSGANNSVGPYTAAGSAPPTGVPVITHHGNAILAAFQPEQSCLAGTTVTTSPNSTEAAIKLQTDLIATNTGDSPAAKTAQTNSGTAAAFTTSNNKQSGDIYPVVTNVTYGLLALYNLLNTVGSAVVAVPLGVWNVASSAITGSTSVGARLLNFLGIKVYADPPTPPTTGQIAAAILKTPANLLVTNSDGSVNSTGGGGTIQNIITIPPAVAIGSLSPSQITCVRGDTLSIVLPLMGDLSTRTKIVMTAKANTGDSDLQAVFQAVESIGLTRLNGSDPVSSSTASLMVTNASTGSVTLEIDASVTAMFAVQDLNWDVQAYLSTGIITPISGMFSISADVTRSVT